MKSIALIILMIMLYGASSAQHVAISNDRMNVVYVGISNPLSIAMDYINCKDLIVSTNNGTIEKRDSCHFSYLCPPSQYKK